MARGKTIDIWKYVAKLKPYLEKGATVHDACISAGIPYRTVKDYMADREDVRQKIKEFENLSIWEARKCLSKGVKKDPALALKYLERKRKNEFSTKIESSNINYHRLDNVKVGGVPLQFDFGKRDDDSDDDTDE